MSDPVVNVVVADDHSIYRAGLRELLEEEHLRVVGEASDGAEAVRETLRTSPDVVVMDVRMPIKDGIAASREIKQQRPGTEIVIISGLDEPRHLFEAIDAGARAYVGKDEAPEVLLEAVRSAAAGGAYLAPAAVRAVFERISASPRSFDPAPAPVQVDARLTQREREVLRLLAQGSRNQDIANKMNLSSRSIGNHLAKIYNKLHIHGRSEAVLYALRSGIAALPAG